MREEKPRPGVHSGRDKSHDFIGKQQVFDYRKNRECFRHMMNPENGEPVSQADNRSPAEAGRTRILGVAYGGMVSINSGCAVMRECRIAGDYEVRQVRLTPPA